MVHNGVLIETIGIAVMVSIGLLFFSKEMKLHTVNEQTHNTYWYKHTL